MTDVQTTFARATLEYDHAHERALMEAVTAAIFETSAVSDANAIVLRTAETIEALLTCWRASSRCRPRQHARRQQ